MSVQSSQSIQDIPQYARRQILANGQQRKKLRANASLPKQAWVGIEDAVYPALDDQLTIVRDLRNAGLTIEESVFNKVTEWHKQDYQSEATVSMDPETETEEGNVEYDLDGSPIPLIHSDFSIGFRDSGTEGNPPGGMAGENLEALNAEGSGRVVAEAMEKLTIHGWQPTIGGEDLGGTQDGYTMYGLTTHPNTHTGTLSDWTTEPEQIRSDLKDSMARDLKDDNFRPTNAGYWIYVGESLEDVLDDPDPEGTGDRLVRDRIENLNFVGRLDVSEYLANDAVLMFRPTRDVVDLAIALEEQVVQWEDPFRDYFKTITGMTPRVKDTMRGQSGIAYYTGGTS